MGASNGDACDGTDSCSGAANTCVDGYVTTECRASANACDPAESCAGTVASCPADISFDPTITGCTPICRSSGFYGTHARANPAKPGSKNITQAIINAGGGSLNVCGECINATVPVNNAASAVEALCVSPQGTIVLQNVRQLTALALNCIITGAGDDCSGSASLGALFSDCNNACLGLASTRTNAQCRAEIDCFNNGGVFNNSLNNTCQLGSCSITTSQACGTNLPACPIGQTCVPTPGNCHDEPLENAALGLDFEPPGPAGSEADCNAAKKNRCAVLPLTCSATSGQGEACCGAPPVDSCP